ncbi:MAG: response regulator [Candidatus Competibacteraceae bacterium]
MNIKKALVVDDSKVAHLTLRKLLLERTIEVDWVGSGEDCIKYLDNKAPDIIFMDVMMPGMDGFETSRAVTSKHVQSSPPIIMCSANATDEDKRDAKQSGAVGFLSKPYTPEQLDHILKTVSAGTAAILLEEPATPPRPAFIPPAVVEKPVVTPPAPTPVTTVQPTPPRPTAPEVPAPAVPALTVADIEQIAERAAWAAAEKVARDIVQELVPSMARETAAQIARSVSEDGPTCGPCCSTRSPGSGQASRNRDRTRYCRTYSPEHRARKRPGCR